MSTRHTPGPMVVDHNTVDLPFRIYSKATGGNIGYAYAEADADLFAAASDLLDALKFILRGIEVGHIKCVPYRAHADSLETKHPADLIRAAIAKAEGGAA